MKIHKLYLAVLPLVCLVACSDDDSADLKSRPAEMTFTASAEEIAGGPASTWSASDAISVFDGKANNVFTTVGGGSPAEFTGSANTRAEAFRAIRPAIPGVERYSGKVSVVIPASQDGVAGGVAPGADWAAAYAPNDGSRNLRFSNLCAYLRISLRKSDDVVSVQIQSNRGEPLAGPVRVGLFEEPTLEAAAGNSSSVALTGEALDGVFYLAVLPCRLEGGYTLTMTSSEELKHTVVVPEEVVFERSRAYDLGSFADIAWVAAVNPEPSQLPSAALIRAGFAECDFNLVSEGDFEDYASMPIGYRSSWRVHAEAAATAGHGGEAAIRIDNPTPGVWMEMCLQTVALRPFADYEYSAWGQAGLSNVYSGVRCFPGNLLQEIAGASWAPSESWKRISKTFNAGNNYYGDVFCGIWGDPGAFFAIDDVRLIPAGYDKRSIRTSSSSVLGSIANTSFDVVTELGKAVAWRGTNGKIWIALSDATVNGRHYDNAIAYTDAEKLEEGVTVTRFVKSGGTLTPICAAREGEISIVPNAAFVVGDKTYMHYYAKTADLSDNEWRASAAGFLVSDDGGRTWTRSAESWSGEGCFVEASFARKEGYLYMSGSKAGRQPDTYWANMYVARAALTADFTDPGQWDYWTGTEWVSGDESLCREPSCCLTTGCAGESALVYNARFDRFQMIYRSGIHGGLVYRDADAVDGYWSGEKLLVSDDAAGMSYSPSVIDVTADGELLMFVPRL